MKHIIKPIPVNLPPSLRNRTLPMLWCISPWFPLTCLSTTDQTIQNFVLVLFIIPFLFFYVYHMCMHFKTILFSFAYFFNHKNGTPCIYSYLLWLINIVFMIHPYWCNCGSFSQINLLMVWLYYSLSVFLKMDICLFPFCWYYKHILAYVFRCTCISISLQQWILNIFDGDPHT